MDCPNATGCLECKVTSHKAETLFLPLLSNALKAQKLRSTLGVFERSKFLFGLPRALRMNVRAVRRIILGNDYLAHRS